MPLGLAYFLIGIFCTVYFQYTLTRRFVQDKRYVTKTGVRLFVFWTILNMYLRPEFWVIFLVVQGLYHFVKTTEKRLSVGENS